MPVARSGKARNRAIRDEDQPEYTPEQTKQEAFNMDVRLAARAGLTYGEIAQKFSIDLDEVREIIKPDLIQKVDAETQELIPE